MRLHHPLVGIVVTSSLLLASCGGGGSGSSGDDAKDAGTSEVSDAEAAVGTDVKIADFTFDPGEVEVEVGEVVTFTNDDDADHTATANRDAPQAFDTDTIVSGDSAEITFEEPGEYEYFCSIHEYMSGTVRVIG